ncbi:hypothetical protein [Gymnodinialimonas sp. 57CJ19]|uniref:hypothetical protein n=1 Tax=Gymnodinialimonas sp. 57CJ19 TaxID=3138498 RepID=UPI0031343917
MAGKSTDMSEVAIAGHKSTNPSVETWRKAQRPEAADGGITSEKSFDNELRSALRSRNIAGARNLVANAEAVLAAHNSSPPKAALVPSPAQLAAAKARIAMAVGDGAAARAILLLAIERSPKDDALRALLAEVMLADGRATDVRPVLNHLNGGTSGVDGAPKDTPDT